MISQGHPTEKQNNRLKLKLETNHAAHKFYNSQSISFEDHLHCMFLCILTAHVICHVINSARILGKKSHDTKCELPSVYLLIDLTLLDAGQPHLSFDRLISLLIL